MSKNIYLFLLGGLVLFFLSGFFYKVQASHLPARSVADNPRIVDVQLLQNVKRGVVPFEVDFSLSIYPGTDHVKRAEWDFDGDGLIDYVGFNAEKEFLQPVDQEVTCYIYTSSHGMFTRKTMVRGYNALMTLTFDDGHATVYDNALNILSSRGGKGNSLYSHRLGRHEQFLYDLARSYRSGKRRMGYWQPYS